MDKEWYQIDSEYSYKTIICFKIGAKYFNFINKKTILNLVLSFLPKSPMTAR